MKCKRTIDQLGEDLPSVQDLCRSDKFSQQPFLGPTDLLQDVITRDLETLKRLNVSHVQVAQRMRSLLIAAYNSPKVNVRISDRIENTRQVKRNQWCCWSNTSHDVGKFIVEITSWGGAQKCPFQSPEDKAYHGYQYGSTDVYVLNKDTNEVIFFGSLLPHMIKRHAFFESTEPYRVDPETVVRILEISPLQNYRLKRTLEPIWGGVGNYPSIPSDAVVVYKSNTRIYMIAESLPTEMWTLPARSKSYVESSLPPVAEEPLTIGGTKVILQPFLDGIYRLGSKKFYQLDEAK